MLVILFCILLLLVKWLLSSMSLLHRVILKFFWEHVWGSKNLMKPTSLLFLTQFVKYWKLMHIDHARLIAVGKVQVDFRAQLFIALLA